MESGRWTKLVFNDRKRIAAFFAIPDVGDVCEWNSWREEELGLAIRLNF